MKLLTKRNMAIGAVVIGIPALVLAWWLIPRYSSTLW
jgi:hypothetical protein